MSGGVLPYQGIKEFVVKGNIISLEGIKEDQIQPSSLDLTTGNKCYRLKSSFLPGNKEVLDAMQSRVVHTFNYGEEGLVLEKGVVYLFPLNEKIRLPEDFKARANPKSSIGRDDLFTRLISDYSKEYDSVSGTNLWLEVVPLSFPVLVRPNLPLNQVKFYYDEPRISDSRIKQIHRTSPLLYDENDKPLEELIVNNGIYLSANLGLNVVGYRALRNPEDVADLSKVAGNKKENFWEPISKSKDSKIILNPGDFMILATKERISMPLDHCAEVVAFDAKSGELRTHYAGFIDAGFDGFLTLEVRARDVPFEIEDGQRICRIVVEKLTETSSKGYGKEIGSSYKGAKGPKLSKIFY